MDSGQCARYTKCHMEEILIYIDFSTYLLHYYFLVEHLASICLSWKNLKIATLAVRLFMQLTWFLQPLSKTVMKRITGLKCGWISETIWNSTIFTYESSAIKLCFEQLMWFLKVIQITNNITAFESEVPGFSDLCSSQRTILLFQIL